MLEHYAPFENRTHSYTTCWGLPGAGAWLWLARPGDSARLDDARQYQCTGWPCHFHRSRATLGCLPPPRRPDFESVRSAELGSPPGILSDVAVLVHARTRYASHTHTCSVGTAAARWIAQPEQPGSVGLYYRLEQQCGGGEATPAPVMIFVWLSSRPEQFPQRRWATHPANP